MFEHVRYEDLTSRQQENYNFQKLASRLADYGYNCLRLSDDWQGADFIACHIDGNSFIKVQLKGRLSIDRKYNEKGVYIAFNDKNDQWYIYPHDKLRDELLDMGLMSGTVSWEERGMYNWPGLTKRLAEHMAQYAI